MSPAFLPLAVVHVWPASTAYSSSTPTAHLSPSFNGPRRFSRHSAPSGPIATLLSRSRAGGPPGLRVALRQAPRASPSAAGARASQCRLHHPPGGHDGDGRGDGGDEAASSMTTPSRSTRPYRQAERAAKWDKHRRRRRRESAHTRGGRAGAVPRGLPPAGEEVVPARWLWAGPWMAQQQMQPRSRAAERP